MEKEKQELTLAMWEVMGEHLISELEAIELKIKQLKNRIKNKDVLLKMLETRL